MCCYFIQLFHYFDYERQQFFRILHINPLSIASFWIVCKWTLTTANCVCQTKTMFIFNYPWRDRGYLMKRCKTGASGKCNVFALVHVFKTQITQHLSSFPLHRRVVIKRAFPMHCTVVCMPGERANLEILQIGNQHYRLFCFDHYFD